MSSFSKGGSSPPSGADTPSTLVERQPINHQEGVGFFGWILVEVLFEQTKKNLGCLGHLAGA